MERTRPCPLVASPWRIRARHAVRKARHRCRIGSTISLGWTHAWTTSGQSWTQLELSGQPLWESQRLDHWPRCLPPRTQSAVKRSYFMGNQEVKHAKAHNAPSVVQRFYHYADTTWGTGASLPMFVPSAARDIPAHARPRQCLSISFSSSWRDTARGRRRNRSCRYCRRPP